MAFGIVRPETFSWITRPHEPGEPARHVAQLSEDLGLERTSGNVWRYEPGAAGRRHRERTQEEVFVVVAGTLSVYLGEPPERHDVPTGGVVRVAAGTPIQNVNHGDVDLLVYAYGAPPGGEGAEILDSAV
jgi:mannose-6-phosphate isomerase-like protein (cupin superfamily)